MANGELITGYVFRNPRPGQGEVKDCAPRSLANMLSLFGFRVDYDAVLAFIKEMHKGDSKRVQNVSLFGSKKVVMDKILAKHGLFFEMFPQVLDRKTGEMKYDERFREECLDKPMLIRSLGHIAFRDRDGTIYDSWDSTKEEYFMYVIIPDDGEFLRSLHESICAFEVAEEKKDFRQLDRRKSTKKTNFIRLTEEYFLKCDRTKFAAFGGTKSFVDHIVKNSKKDQHGNYTVFPMNKVRQFPGFRQQIVRGMIRWGFLEYVV